MRMKWAFLVLVVPMMCHSAGAGLIRYWALEEGSGTVAKDSSDIQLTK